MARAASASAGAPGAQGVLTKTAACQLNAASEVGGGHHAPAGALHLAQGELAAAALDDHGIVANGNDRAGISAIRCYLRYRLFRGHRFRQRLSPQRSVLPPCASNTLNCSPSSRVSATGQGLNARTCRSISSASRVQSISASALSIFAA